MKLSEIWKKEGGGSKDRYEKEGVRIGTCMCVFWRLIYPNYLYEHIACMLIGL